MLELTTGADMGEPSTGWQETFGRNATDKEVQFPRTRG